MTDSINTLNDLKALDESELWKIAGDDEHPHQLAAQAILRNGEPNTQQNTAEATDEPKPQSRGSEPEDGEKGTPLDELCDRIIDMEDTSEQLKDVCRAVRTGVEEGEIDRYN